MARASTTRSSRRRACCARKSRTHSPSLSCWDSCTRTASRDCAHCSRRPSAANRSSASRTPDAGRSSADRRRKARPAAPSTDPSTKSSSTSPTRCCGATVSCSGASSSASRRGFRRGASCCACCGGRFVAGIPGEQFALPEALALLRETRRAPPSATWISLSAADPLNLIGNLVPGPKVPAVTSNRILYRDGLPVAALVAGETQWKHELAPREMREAESLLVKLQPGSPLLAYLR